MDLRKVTKKFKLPELVVVTWIDASHEFGWMDGNDDVDADPPVCLSTGWLLKQTKTAVKLCQTIAADNHAQTLTIPKGMIKGIQSLRPAMEFHEEGKR